MDDTLPSAPRVGVIGLGAMGLPMARRLIDAGVTVLHHARRRVPELEDLGSPACATPRALASRVDAILVMLPDLPQLEQMLDGPDGIIAAESSVLLMIGSTSSPVAVRALAARVQRESSGRIRVVDTPVSGGTDGAEAGTLSIMIGGDPADAAAVIALLAPCGTGVHLGPLGAGDVAKACNQLVVAATILALGEATVLAERSGIDPDLLWRTLEPGYAGSNVLASRRDMLVAGDDAPSGMAKYMVKDLRFAAEIAADTSTAPALLPALRETFDDLVAAGLGDRDIAVTRRYTAERAARHPLAWTSTPFTHVGEHCD